jgi:spore germination protein YaaH
MRGARFSGLITAASLVLLTALVVSLAPAAATAAGGSPSPSDSSSPSASPTATPTPSPATPPGPRLGSPEIFGWLPYWSLGANIDYGAITTIAYFGLVARADGTLAKSDGNGWNSEYSGWMGSKVSQAISQAHANGDRFVLSVERFAWDNAGKTATAALLSDPNARATLVADIVNEITARGVDGVSLDFEPILADQRDNFAAFVRELRLGLDAANPAYQLTFATTGSQTVKTLQMINDLTSGGWADAEIIMGYPLRALDAARAGSLDPLSSPTSYDLKQIVNTHLGYVAPDKIVLALPWYAREWPTQTADVNAKVQTDRSLYGRPQNSTYQAGLNKAIQYGRQLDPAEEVAWTAYQEPNCTGCPVTWMEIYYDDVETFGYKVDWALSKGLAGIGIFALGYDNGRPEFWKLLEVKFGRPQKLVDDAAPTGTFGLDPGDKLCAAPQVQLDFSLSDGQNGSGAVLMAVSNSSATTGGGLLSAARVYPVMNPEATNQVSWAMDDPSTGGSLTTGTRQVYAQWRDVAGNWSTVSSTSFKLTLPGTAQLTVAGGAAYTSSTSVGVLVQQTGGRTIQALKLSNSPTLSGGVLADAVDVSLGTTNSFSLIDPATGGTDGGATRPAAGRTWPARR